MECTIRQELVCPTLAIWLLTHHQTCSQFRFCELADPRQKGVVAFVMQLDWLQIEIGWLQFEIGWSMTLGDCMYLVQQLQAFLGCLVLLVAN